MIKKMETKFLGEEYITIFPIRDHGNEFPFIEYRIDKTGISEVWLIISKNEEFKIPFIQKINIYQDADYAVCGYAQIEVTFLVKMKQ
jgi:hypothetical protein